MKCIKSARADLLASEVRAIIREVIPESPMYRVFTIEQLPANTMGSLSFTMLMIGVSAVLAVILGAVGLYGVLSYSVSQRTQEIGVRRPDSFPRDSAVRRISRPSIGAPLGLTGRSIGVL